VPKLEARGLSKYFFKRGTPIEVLSGINFQVSPGEFVAIVGASGCGKTTLLRMADGLEEVSEGALLIDGKERLRPGPDRGFAFQQDTLMPWRNVLKNVALGLELQGRPREQNLEQAARFIEMVGLKGFERHYPHELSGGMRQRANLARAFCIEPDILLMDEPFAALDAQTREIMQDELLRIWRTSGGTVLFITHQIDEAIFLADRIIVLTARPGRVREIVTVPFARPRELAIKRTAEFGAIYDRIWRMIEEEVRASMGMTAG
jgi:NitT/TauT family transport system ATP-binding protein